MKTPEPAAAGAMIELLVRVSARNVVSARGVICNVQPGSGMGVKFVQMRGEARLCLNQFLNTQLKAGKIELNGPASEAPQPRTDDVPSEKDDARPGVSTSEFDPKTTAAADISEEELQRCLTLAETGTHYHLLGITTESSKEQVKQGFYLVARRFHPDRHMNRPHWKERLQQLVGAATKAYETLSERATFPLRQPTGKWEPYGSAGNGRGVREDCRCLSS